MCAGDHASLFHADEDVNAPPELNSDESVYDAHHRAGVGDRD